MMFFPLVLMFLLPKLINTQDPETQRVRTRYHYHRQLGGRDYVIILSFYHYVNSITDEHVNGCRPNMAGMGKG